MAADFGTFGLLWIVTNLIFFMALIVAGVILTKWLARRSQARKQGAEHQLPQNPAKLSRFDHLRVRYEHGDLTKEQYQQMVAQLKQQS